MTDIRLWNAKQQTITTASLETSPAGDLWQRGRGSLERVLWTQKEPPASFVGVVSEAGGACLVPRDRLADYGGGLAELAAVAPASGPRGLVVFVLFADGVAFFEAKYPKKRKNSFMRMDV